MVALDWLIDNSPAAEAALRGAVIELTTGTGKPPSAKAVEAMAARLRRLVDRIVVKECGSSCRVRCAVLSWLLERRNEVEGWKKSERCFE